MFISALLRVHQAFRPVVWERRWPARVEAERSSKVPVPRKLTSARQSHLASPRQGSPALLLPLLSPLRLLLLLLFPPPRPWPSPPPAGYRLPPPPSDESNDNTRSILPDPASSKAIRQID